MNRARLKQDHGEVCYDYLTHLRALDKLPHLSPEATPDQVPTAVAHDTDPPLFRVSTTVSTSDR